MILKKYFNIFKQKELSKFPDYNPSKTTYLLKFELKTLAQQLQMRMHKQLENFYSIKYNLVTKNSALLEKKQNFEDLIASNSQSVPENLKLEDVLTSGEFESLQRFEKLSNNFDSAILRLSPIVLFFDAHLNENVV